jgi:hypothetical protein
MLGFEPKSVQEFSSLEPNPFVNFHQPLWFVANTIQDLTKKKWLNELSRK